MSYDQCRFPHLRMFIAHLSLRKLQVAAVLAGILLLSGVYTLLSRESSPASILTAVAAGDQRYEMFLKLDTIAGESTDLKHRGEISVDSFAWGESRSMGATRPTMDGIKITMPANKASPRLFLYTAGGLKVGRAVLSVRMAGSATDMLKWILTDSQIVSYQTVGNTHGDGVMDQITLVPGKVEVELVPGDGTATVKAGWDQRTGKSVAY